MCISSDAALCLADRPRLRRELRHEAQCHAEDQTQRRDDPPEEVDELVRGHDLIIARKPEDDYSNYDGGGQAVADADIHHETADLRPAALLLFEGEVLIQKIADDTAHNLVGC